MIKHYKVHENWGTITGIFWNGGGVPKSCTVIPLNGAKNAFNVPRKILTQRENGNKDPVSVVIINILTSDQNMHSKDISFPPGFILKSHNDEVSKIEPNSPTVILMTNEHAYTTFCCTICFLHAFSDLWSEDMMFKFNAKLKIPVSQSLTSSSANYLRSGLTCYCELWKILLVQFPQHSQVWIRIFVYTNAKMTETALLYYCHVTPPPHLDTPITE